MANPNPSPETRFKPNNPGGPKGPRKPSVRRLFREALEQPSTESNKTRIEKWCDDWSNTKNRKTRLELVKWLEGSSPKESQEPISEQPSQQFVPPNDIVRAYLLSLGWIPPEGSEEEPGGLSGSSEHRTVEAGETSEDAQREADGDCESQDRPPPDHHASETREE